MNNKEILGFCAFFGILSYFSALSAFGETPPIVQLVMLGIFALVAGIMAFGFFSGITKDIVTKEGWSPVLVILLVIAFVGWNIIPWVLEDAFHNTLWIGAGLFGCFFLGSLISVFIPKKKDLRPLPILE